MNKNKKQKRYFKSSKEPEQVNEMLLKKLKYEKGKVFNLKTQVEKHYRESISLRKENSILRYSLAGTIAIFALYVVFYSLSGS